METTSQAQEAALYTKENPLVTKVTDNYILNKEGSIKDTRHIAISLEASGVNYIPGDSLYIFPENDSELVIRQSAGLSSWRLINPYFIFFVFSKAYLLFIKKGFSLY